MSDVLNYQPQPSGSRWWLLAVALLIVAAALFVALVLIHPSAPAPTHAVYLQ